ncbi:zinc finger protein 839 [Tiliqua scincoides]|uniref:zinc finger protein 839 n=1 Tax=Tiliqua scincoides TaxID=71010 RepID=UPI0034617DF5
MAAAVSPDVTLISACSPNSITNHEKKQKIQKFKKSLKVKTRSGRISRPPKYKAKDYKFIKIEDLADCHQSDSDDYSELSVEDDEEGKAAEAPSLFGSLNYDLRPKLFKCQTCEKSYIGKGGLARHYKLNPDHGQQESSQSSSVNRPHRMALLGDIGKINSESVYQNSSLPPPRTVALINENALAIDVGKNLSSEIGQQSGTCVEDRIFEEQQNAHLLHVGSRRPRRPRRCSRPKMPERSRYSGRFNRSSQFPSKSLNNMSAEHQSVFRRKARLKELIQQCANEDFMELAVPRFTTLVTVFEFLLMKVADSLGITDILRLQKIHGDFSPECIKSTHDYVVTEILGQKRAAESSDEILPFAKKTGKESLLENVNINDSRPSGVKERNSINEGFTPEESCAADSFSGNRILEKGQHESLELEADNDYIDPDQICEPMKMASANSQPSRIPRSDHSDSLSSWCEILPTVSTEISQEKVGQVNSSWNAASKQYEPEVCNFVVPEVAGLNPDLLVLEENDNEKCEDQEEAIKDSPVVTCSGLPQGSAQSKKAFSMNTMFVAHPFGTPVQSRCYTSSCSENS